MRNAYLNWQYTSQYSAEMPEACSRLIQKVNCEPIARCSAIPLPVPVLVCVLDSSAFQFSSAASISLSTVQTQTETEMINRERNNTDKKYRLSYSNQQIVNKTLDTSDSLNVLTDAVASVDVIL